TITLNNPPPALVKTTTIITGNGQDHVLVNDYGGATTIDLGNGPDTVDVRVATAKTSGVDSLVVNGGTGPETTEIASKGDNAHTTFNGGSGIDSVVIESVGNDAFTEIFGGDDPFTIRVEVANLPTTATTILHGDLSGATDADEDPASVSGDVLIVDPQDPTA